MKAKLFATGLLFCIGCSSAPDDHATSAAAICVVPSVPAPCASGQCIGPQGDSKTFPETGIAVRGSFLEYMNKVSVSSTGLPLSNPWKSVSSDGKAHYTQCFERQVLEFHEDLANNCEAVVLGRQLARNRFVARYGANGPRQDLRRLTNPNDQVSCFKETPHCIEPIMYDWWQRTGGVAVNGFPISDYFEEESPEEPGKKYWVQYFERTVGEYHQAPEGGWYVEGQLLGKYAPECPNVAGAKLALVSTKSAEITRNHGFDAQWWTTTEVGGETSIGAFRRDGTMVLRITKTTHEGKEGIAIFPNRFSASDVTAILAAYANDNEGIDGWECFGTLLHSLLNAASTVVDCWKVLDWRTGFDATFCTNDLETTPHDLADLADACLTDHDPKLRGTKADCQALDNGLFAHVLATCSGDDKCVCSVH